MPPATRSLYPWKNFFQCLCFFLTPSPFSLFLFFCPYHPLFIFLLLFPPLLPPSSSSLTALFHLCRVESCVFPLSSLQPSWFVRSLLLLSCLNSFCLLSPPFLLSSFILCFSPPFSFCFQRSLCSSAPPFSLSFSVPQPSTYTPCRFVSLVPALFFLFFLFSSFFLSVHARACTRVRCTLRANRSLSRKPLLSQVCSKLDSLPPPGWTVRVFDSTSILIPEVILGRRTWKLRMAVLENL